MNMIQHFNQIKNRYSQDNRQAMRNPWVLGWIAIIATFLIVNAGLVFLSLTNSPGLVTEDYYEQGRKYERNAIRLLSKRNNLTWDTKLYIPEIITSHTLDIYRFSATDIRGLPVKNASVTLVAYRPSDANADFTVPFQQIAPGLYQAKASFSLPGIWDINIKVQRDDDQYELSQRIMVKRR